MNLFGLSLLPHGNIHHTHFPFITSLQSFGRKIGTHPTRWDAGQMLIDVV